MTKPKPTYQIGDKFKLTNDALENYGEQYRDKVFTVRSWANHYVPAKEYFADPKQHAHGHPGYDDATGDCLYEADGMTFAVYSWEMERA
jgi:hypothetical protein